MTEATPVRAGQCVFPDLSPFLNPSSIAVIGASDTPGNIGGVAVRFLREFGYPGDIYPVNPRRKEVAGLTSYESVGTTPAAAELAVLAVPAAAAPDMIRSSSAAGVPAGVLWAGGFAEAGASGRALQQEVARACSDTGFRLLGPNCIGFINSRGPVLATFASFLNDLEHLTPGVISMASQSGGLGTQAQAYAERAGSGFRYMVSTGNEADLTVADFIATFAADDMTEVIAVYLEGIGDGERLVAALTRAGQAGKPVVMLRGGSTSASARAAAAHTSALAGQDRVLRAVLAELRVVQVDSLEELLDTCLLLASPGPRPRGRRLAVVTFGGGGGVLAADHAARHGLTVPELAEVTTDKLSSLLPPIAALANPVDATPQAFNDRHYLGLFADALATVDADAGIDSTLVICGPMSQGADEVVAAIAALRDHSAKVVSVAWPLCPPSVRLRLQSLGFTVFEEPARAIAALARSVREAPRLASGTAGPLLRAAWDELTAPARARDVLTEDQCHRLLAAAGLPVAPAALVTEPSGLPAAIGQVGLPVVLKAISAQVPHRHAAGLVALDVRSEAEARAGYDALLDRAGQLGVQLDGIYLQRMIQPALELLVSAFRDPVLGVIVSCGAGGTLTELLDDVTFARAPLSRRDAGRLLGQLRLVRKRAASIPAGGLAAAAGFVAGFSRLAAAAPYQRFTLEVNPIVVAADGAVAAVDGLLIVDQP